MGDGQESQRRWIIGLLVTAVLGILAVFAALVVGVGAILATVNQTYDPLNLQPNGRLVPMQAESEPALPAERGTPTELSLRNEGEREARVKAARLYGGSWDLTPPPVWGAGPPIYVDFEAGDFDSEKNEFYRPLPQSEIPVDQSALATITIIDPAHAGWTYSGWIEFEYDENGVTPRRWVEVDAVAEPPIR